MHAQNRHKNEWATFQGYETDAKEAATVERQERQLEATMALARGASTRVESSIQCDDCGKECKSEFGLRSHARSHK